ncbi:hypothetical protein Y032_0823g2538 [Ancylostoma ceylanicum]|uniref:Uncharacterized protein n=1 Tax=Ancylostoma ceylanicum TaxID=53326 RepID=A0A016WC07_9BILA|nr:hypothetical protein Y032_0823g2538 [Ancylostoma ceylanicum]
MQKTHALSLRFKSSSSKQKELQLLDHILSTLIEILGGIRNIPQNELCWHSKISTMKISNLKNELKSLFRCRTPPFFCLHRVLTVTHLFNVYVRPLLLAIS